MTPIRTNPAYAHLAYQKAIKKRLSVYLHRSFLGDELGESVDTIVSDDVFQLDREVPVEEVQRYIEQLNEEIAGLDIELRKFSLTRDIQNESERTKGTRGRHETRRQSSRKRGRSSRTNGR